MKNNLKKYQNQLIKDFIKNPKQMEAIMNQYRNWNEAVETAKFHKYSISNLILANHQLYLRTGHGIELLAPYKRWNKVNLIRRRNINCFSRREQRNYRRIKFLR